MSAADFARLSAATAKFSGSWPVDEYGDLMHVVDDIGAGLETLAALDDRSSLEQAMRRARKRRRRRPFGLF